MDVQKKKTWAVIFHKIRPIVQHPAFFKDPDFGGLMDFANWIGRLWTIFNFFQYFSFFTGGSPVALRGPISPKHQICSVIIP